ncbi:MAG: DNRLRE domain-containing protein, partial [Dehalococcoidia bacterium]
SPTPTDTPSPTPTDTPTATPTDTPTPASGLTFAPVADSYVNDALPGNNYGTGSALRVDASPIMRAYLRFDVQGAGTIMSATLRIWANSSQSVGYEVHGVADNLWGETTINFTNAPAFDPASAGSSGRITAATWTSVDVTSLVQANGLVSFMLLTTNSTQLSLSSRETGLTAPQLVITTAPAGGAVLASSSPLAGATPAIASQSTINQPATARAVIPDPPIVASVEPSASPLPLPEPAATPTPVAGP